MGVLDWLPNRPDSSRDIRRGASTKKIRDFTSLGGSAAFFPATTGGLLSGLAGPKSPARAVAVEEFCRRYWKPAYRYVRMNPARTNEDAKDITQSFFLWMIETEEFRKFDGERGSFRTFLKLRLQTFVKDWRKHAERLKRGGGALFQRIGDGELPIEAPADPNVASPEEAFDAAWTLDISHRAIERVRSEYEGERARLFEIFEAYALNPVSERPTYRDLAQRFGLRESAVRNHLAAVRKSIRQAILDELSAATRTPQEAQEEWNALFGG